MKTSDQIREEFLSFFENNQHRRVKSSSLVPHNDATLLFTNAGMNQFKEIFLGVEKRNYSRATTSQKCMRVSGKHNDLETVGRTPRHHTFFEMLGNFSFGDYFKKEAIGYAWELCTEVYGINPERLSASVFEKDDDAFDLWHTYIGLPENRIYRLGAKENFWSMGETGPCGPCSEIHYDLNPEDPLPSGGIEAAPDRFLEIWNLVFMQFDRASDGGETALPKPSIDTGMGLERIACVLQEQHTTYDTDLFRPIIQEASRLTGIEYGGNADSDTSLRILADHSRACAFLISDSISPGNEGRGYVLRKILRRAIRHGKMLGKEEPFIHSLVALIGDMMSDAYPELSSSRDYAARLVRTEEENFSSTLKYGLELLDELVEDLKEKGIKKVPGKELFRLYDTYGFPLDLATEIAEERGYAVDSEDFYKEMEKQRERARASWKGIEKSVNPAYKKLSNEFHTTFTGYVDTQDVKGQILAILRDGDPTDNASAGDKVELILDQSPFYAESGGQVGDTGTIQSNEGEASVHNTLCPVTGLHLQQVVLDRGTIRVGDNVVSNIDLQRRKNIARNHSATHILQAALREVLGEHVKQAGSLVAPDRLRFDFNHFQSLTPTQLPLIEEIINQKIQENTPIKTSKRSLNDALNSGATALFGEKYGDEVRVVEMSNFSMELCGGTHVNNTGEIGLFKLTGESSISAGVRRIEALTGDPAMERFLESERMLSDLATDLRVNRQDISEAVDRIGQQLKEANRTIEDLQLKLARNQTGDAASEARTIHDVKVLVKRVSDLDRSGLRSLADQLRTQLQSGIVVLGMALEGKVSLIAMVSDDLTGRIRADELISLIAQTVKGGGGGRPQMAEAGGNDPAKLDIALEQAFSEIAGLLGPIEEPKI